MSSFIWLRDPKEAFANPYEYEAQEQFDREATRLLKTLYDDIAHATGRRQYRDERTVEKAVWLLHLDALGSLADAHDSLQRKRHRVIPLLSRSIQDTLDLAAVFSSRTPESAALLTRWFNNDILLPRDYAAHLPPTNQGARQRRKDRYRNLSRYTHRTYRAIMDGYCLASDGHIFHDQSGMAFRHASDVADTSALPHTIAAYYALLAADIWFLTEELIARATLSQAEVDAAIATSFEATTVPRRFFPTGNHSGAIAEMRAQLRKGQKVTFHGPPTPDPNNHSQHETQDVDEEHK